jgi:hypothetical protein
MHQVRPACEAVLERDRMLRLAQRDRAFALARLGLLAQVLQRWALW